MQSVAFLIFVLALLCKLVVWAVKSVDDTGEIRDAASKGALDWLDRKLK